ncbi:hypothetical protein [Desulfovibrio inopinatus]|uniref:hypothetical protein n=1 Tax=Desulfovibrio inopinatus TaxID=102109 RepID=UPI0004282A23|nr:hypothetical protein [Desulfovibrio inopinatus]
MKQLILIGMLLLAGFLQGCADPYYEPEPAPTPPPYSGGGGGGIQGNPRTPGCAQQANRMGLVGPERQRFIEQCVHR